MLYVRSIRHHDLAVFHERKERGFTLLLEGLDTPGRRMTDGGLVWEETSLSMRDRRLLRREYARRLAAHRRMRHFHERAEWLPWLRIEPDPTIRVVSDPTPQIITPTRSGLISSFEVELQELDGDEEDARRSVGLTLE